MATEERRFSAVDNLLIDYAKSPDFEEYHLEDDEEAAALAEIGNALEAALTKVTEERDGAQRRFEVAQEVIRDFEGWNGPTYRERAEAAEAALAQAREALRQAEDDHYEYMEPRLGRPEAYLCATCREKQGEPHKPPCPFADLPPVKDE